MRGRQLLWVAICGGAILLLDTVTLFCASVPQNITISGSSCQQVKGPGNSDCDDCATGSIPDPRTPAVCKGVNACVGVQCAQKQMKFCQCASDSEETCNQTTASNYNQCSSCVIWFSDNCAAKSGNCANSPDCPLGGGANYNVNGTLACTPCDVGPPP